MSVILVIEKCFNFAEYNFAKLFFPKNTIRGITLTVEELQSDLIIGLLLPTLDSAELTIFLERKPDTIDVIGEIADLTALSSIDSARFHGIKIPIPACSARIAEYVNEFPLKGKLETWPSKPVTRDPIEKIVNAFNCLANLAIFDLREIKTALKFVLTASALATLENLPENGLLEGLSNQIKLDKACVKIAQVLAEKKTQLNIWSYIKGSDRSRQKKQLSPSQS